MSETTTPAPTAEASPHASGPWPRSAVRAWMASMPQSRRRLLNRAEADPSVVLADERCREPLVCMAFFEICDGKALTEPDRAVEWASTGVDLAYATGNPHLIHYGLGVLSHAHLARKEREEARQVLNGYRDAALECCPHCRSDWQRRMADYYVESSYGGLALPLLESALEEPGAEIDDDARGRLRFLRGIAYRLDGRRAPAVADAGAALRELSLASPRGYFLDTIALLACFLIGAGPAEDEEALEHLLCFKRRLKDREGFSEVRYRAAWVEGQLHARLGDVRRGRDRLESVLAALRADAPPLHVVAVTADLVQLHARRTHESNIRPALVLIGRCRAMEGLDEETQRRLEKVETVLRRVPEKAFAAIAELRKSFVVPVPGLLAERPPETWHRPVMAEWSVELELLVSEEFRPAARVAEPVREPRRDPGRTPALPDPHELSGDGMPTGRPRCRPGSTTTAVLVHRRKPPGGEMARGRPRYLPVPAFIAARQGAGLFAPRGPPPSMRPPRAGTL